MAAKKILMICGDYCEDYETMVPFQALLAVGHTVHAVCPDKKAGDQIKTAIHDFEGAQTYSEKPGHNFALNATFADIDVQAYDALVLPGGRGPEYLRTYPAVVAMVRHFFETNKPVAAICHAAQLLAGADVLRGRSCSAYPACQVEVERAGGTYANIAIDGAFTEGNLVSAPGLARAPGLDRPVFDLAGHKNHVVNLAESGLAPGLYALTRAWHGRMLVRTSQLPETATMCQVFINADPHLYACRARSVRLHGVATSIRLENLFWNVLADIAQRDGMSVPQLCTKLYDELVTERDGVDNFASFLRVCCGRYLALQLSGGIPQDTSIPIASLNAQRVLDTEKWAMASHSPLSVVPSHQRRVRAA